MLSVATICVMNYDYRVQSTKMETTILEWNLAMKQIDGLELFLVKYFQRLFIFVRTCIRAEEATYVVRSCIYVVIL